MSSLTLQIKTMATTSATASYETVVKNINEKLEVLMTVLNELVEAAKKEEKTLEETAIAAGEQIKKLMAKCEGVLKELLSRLNDLYIKTIPDDQKEVINKTIESAKERVTKGLLQVEDAFKTGGEAGLAQYDKVSEWTNDIKKQIGPGMEAARDYLTSYSPSAMEKASEAVAVFSNNQLGFANKLTCSIQLLFAALWILFTTAFNTFTNRNNTQKKNE